MIAITLTLLFVVAAAISIASLADSAVRGRNAWRSIRREMAIEQSTAVQCDVVAFRDVKPARHLTPAQPQLNRLFAAAA